MRNSLLALMMGALWFVVSCGGSFGGGYASAPAHQSAEMDMAAPMPEPMAPGAADMSGGDFGPMEERDRYAQVDTAIPTGEGAPEPPPPPTNKPDVVGEGPDPTQPATTKIRQLLIYTATYHLAVFEATAAIDAAQKLAEDAGGYLVRRGDREITVRVPVDAYRSTLAKMTALGDVLHREETVEDVTERFYDLMVRLKNARALRDRFEQLLAKAENVKEALEVQRELGRVTAEIESMEGRMRVLKELIAFSTITMRFEPRPTEQLESNVKLPFPWLDQLGLSKLLSL